jgi:hypothetical protein
LGHKRNSVSDLRIWVVRSSHARCLADLSILPREKERCQKKASALDGGDISMAAA